MAIDPRIALGVKVAPQVNVADIFNRVRKQNQDLAIGKQNLELGELNIDRQTGTNETLVKTQEQDVVRGGLQNDALIGTNQDAKNSRIIKSAHDFAVSNQSVINDAVNNNDPVPLQQLLVKRRADLKEQGLPTDETDEAISMLGQGNLQGVVGGMADAVTLHQRQQGQGASVGMRERTGLLADYKADPNSPAGQSAGVALGIIAPVRTTAAERASTDAVLGGKVAAQKGAEAEAVEDAKLGSQLKHKPAIARAVKLAEKAAEEKGEVLTDLARMQAGLPGIKKVVNELVELSSVATSTFGGRAFDFAIKESGFGSTKGADARAKLIAIVDNQVLPLLRVTFGAAFTAKEGETLKDSLVNPNSSPSQKKEQLSAFLAQKERDVITKQSQLGINPTAANQDDLDITDPNLTIEQLMAERERLGGQ